VTEPVAVELDSPEKLASNRTRNNGRRNAIRPA
jgi:hypothetical protein